MFHFCRFEKWEASSSLIIYFGLLNKVFNISNVSSTTYTNGYDSNGVQIVDNHGPFDAIPEGIDIPKGSDITITSGGTDYKSKCGR